jgi:hypothetical protein
MIGLSLALLLGGAPAGAPAKAMPDPAELRLFRAVVVAEGTTGETAAEDLPEESDAPPAKVAGEPVPLRKAAVVRAPEPVKEH